MTSYLNFFAPYPDLSATHENQLTRAFIVVLRYSPMAHQAWLRLVAPDRELRKLDAPEFAIQKERIIRGDRIAEEAEEVSGISVWLAPDAESIDAPVEQSDRRQILDAIVSYGRDLVLVIENKISWGKPTHQPFQINRHGIPVTFGHPKSVQWQAVLEAFADLVERKLVHGAERLVISDFLEFVESKFSHIGPYSSLRRCGDSAFRIGRRLDVVQGLATGSDEGRGDDGWRNITGTDKVSMAWLGYDSKNEVVSLELFPADTLGQARAFYQDPVSVKRVLDLRASGWEMRPNFHWGFMTSGLAWCASPLSVEAYCGYWIDQISYTRQVARADWESYCAKLEADGIVDQSGRAAFDLGLVASARPTATPRPGLACEYVWSLQEAKKMDDRGELVGAVRDRINEMLQALRAPELTTARSEGH